MILRLLIALFMSYPVMADIQIISPKNNVVTTSATIEFKARASNNTGFYFINDTMIPIRKKVEGVNIPLTIGENKRCLHILDQSHRMKPMLSQCIKIFRVLPIKDKVSKEDAIILTDLATNYRINFLTNGRVNMTSPILKRDLYAILMWFHLKHPKESQMKYSYTDLEHYSNYVELYKHKSELLPMPFLDRFFPEAYVTRQDFINLLLVLKGVPEQISTSLLVKETLEVPSSLKGLVPSDWEKPLHFVSKQDALSIFKQLYGMNHPILEASDSVYITWENSSIKSLNVVAKYWKKIVEFSDAVKIRSFSTISSWKQSVVNKKLVGGKLNKKKQSNQSSKKEYLKTIIVQSGDSIQKIARRELGRSKDWQKIVDANQLEVKTVSMNGKVVAVVSIFPGQELMIPFQNQE